MIRASRTALLRSLKSSPSSFQRLAPLVSSVSINSNGSFASPQKTPSQQFFQTCRSFSDEVKETSKDEEAKSETKVDVQPPVNAEHHTFQAETRQLLDIVTNSLYTDKEVFLRELVSNASDALEKLRHLQATNSVTTGENSQELEIRIELDEVTSTITITDTGVGMNKEEMIENLGTIARSGSKAFVQQLERAEMDSTTDLDPARGIIGKFGVGFYSAFMVGEKVTVRSKSAQEADAVPQQWTSDGTGSYDIGEVPEGVRQDRGTSVVIHVKEDHWDFVDEKRIEKILKMYSNFVGFPIYLNGTRVNTLDAIWTKEPKTVQEEDYNAFYKFIANAVDEPLDTYHFRADAPIEIKALFFIPSFHSEKYGMGRMEPGVSLYSRKILIESKSPDILPDWLRFVKGVVDSEDLPLAISREATQDTALIGKLRRVLTRKFIAHIAKIAKDDKTKYLDEFYREYAHFLKEGICQDYEFQAQLAKLLYFETSKNTGSDLVSLDEYIARMPTEQKDNIYYLVAPSREAALNSPYLEAFEEAGVEVLFLYTAIDDFVMANLAKYENRNLVSVEKGDIDLSDLKKKEDGDKSNKLYQADRELTTAEIDEFCAWFKTELGEKKVTSCVATNRLSTSPAIVTDNESGAMRRMMRMVDTSAGQDGMPLPQQQVEVNPKHAVIVGIHGLIKTEPNLAKVLAEQVFDNCLVAAGLMDDSRSMLPRLNDLMMTVVSKNSSEISSSESSSSTVEASEEDDKKND